VAPARDEKHKADSLWQLVQYEEQRAWFANEVGIYTNGNAAFGTVDPPPCTPDVGVIKAAVVVVAVGDAPRTKADVVEATEPVEAPTVPVHNALNGQHAIWPAASRAQFVFTGQQALPNPTAEQEL
jgi:hypothetical protein